VDRTGIDDEASLAPLDCCWNRDAAVRLGRHLERRQFRELALRWRLFFDSAGLGFRGTGQAACEQHSRQSHRGNSKLRHGIAFNATLAAPPSGYPAGQSATAACSIALATSG